MPFSAYEATPYPEKNFWTPIHGLDVVYPGSSYLTVMFVSTCRIIYKGSSSNYIFHANQEYSRRPGTYWNPDPRARPLACIDWNEVCTHNGEDCSPMDKEHEEYHDNEYEFTREALRKSKTFNSIQFRLGAAFVAQEGISDDLSRGLNDSQWIIEAQALFETSLARLQFDAPDIDQGIGSGKGSYVHDTPDWAQDKMCGMYKIQLPKGYTNINVSATQFIFGLAALLLILALPTWKKFDDDKEKHFEGNWMVFDLILGTLVFMSRWISHLVSERISVWRNSRSGSTP